MSTEQLIKKKEENMISGSVGGMCVFLSWLAVLPFPFSLSFNILGNPNIVSLQNSHFLSR
jgi:hypothetical protein